MLVTNAMYLDLRPTSLVGGIYTWYCIQSQLSKAIGDINTRGNPIIVIL